MKCTKKPQGKGGCMTTLTALFAVAIVGASAESARLEAALEQRGTAGFLLAVRELEQEQGSERTAKTLVELAGRPKRELAATAAHALGGMGEDGKAVLPELAEALWSSGFPAAMLNELGPGDIPLWLAEVLLRPDDPSFDAAAFSLAVRFDLHGEKRLLPLLIQAAGHADPDEWSWQQYWAIYALGKMRDTAASARPLLVEILKKEPASDAGQSWEWNYTRGAAAYALGQIGAEPESTARLFTGMLKHPKKEIRDWCALGLALLEQHQRPKRAARMLVELRTGCEPQVAAAAAQALGRMGEAGKSVLPELAKSINEIGFPPQYLQKYDPGDIPLWLAEGFLRADDDRTLRHMGSALAWSFDLSGETRLLPLLIQGTKHSSLDGRWWAVEALDNMGEAAASAGPLLVDILKKEPPAYLTPSDVPKWNKVRASAAMALGGIGTEPQSTVRLLTGMLKHPDEALWTSSAVALGRMGEKSAPAIPALVEALTRDEAITPWKTTHAVVSALSRIAEPAIPALIEALQSKNHVVRRRAAEAFLVMYEKKTALGALVKAATEDQDRGVRRVATLALVFPYGSDTDQTVVVPALIRIVKDKDPKVRAAGVDALAGLGPKEFPLQPFLDLFGDPDPNVRLTAVRAFSSLPLNKEMTSALEPLLNDPDDWVRAAARDLRERLRGGSHPANRE